MRSMGAPEAVIERARAEWRAQQPEHPRIVVFPENIPAMRLLIATADQWETPGAFGGKLALPLTEIEAAMRLLHISSDEDTTLSVLAAVRVAREVKVGRFNAEAAARKA